MAKLKVLDLFSGIGGFSLGLERAGMQTVAFCEIEPFCRKILNKHWPDVPIYEDVRNLEYGETIDVICGGFPCQPFSVAGKQKGKEDDRHLWPAMFSLIKKHRPRWVIGENVAGIINMGLDDVLADLEGEAYTTRAFVIPACAVNAPHRRDRVWIIAHSDISYESNVTIDDRSEFMANADSVRPSRGESARDTEEWCEEKQFERRFERVGRNNWQDSLPTPRICRGDDGIPQRVDRLKALGNAVVPQLVEVIGRAIIDH